MVVFQQSCACVEGTDRGELYSIHTEVNLSDFSVGGFISYSDKEADNKDTLSYVASVKYPLTDKLSLLATGNVIDAENSAKDDEWLVAGGEYKYAKNVKLAAEVAAGGNVGTLAYAKVFYWF